jgi:hypothetical protein
LTLYYQCALRRELRQRIERIEDVNTGFSGGEDAQKRVKKLYDILDD